MLSLKDAKRIHEGRRRKAGYLPAGELQDATALLGNALERMRAHEGERFKRGFFFKSSQWRNSLFHRPAF
jgi:hypothetical protein